MARKRKAAMTGLVALLPACSFPDMNFVPEGPSSTPSSTGSGGAGGNASGSLSSSAGSMGMGDGAGTASATSTAAGSGGAGGVDCTNPDKDGDKVNSWQCGGTDCADGDPNAFPGQPTYFAFPVMGPIESGKP